MGDASDVWDGVVLYQETTHYFDKAVAYFSQIFEKHQINYAL
jgi:hypothetical protein